MQAWSAYRSRSAVRGTTKRETILRREIHDINKRLPDSLSYQSAVIYDGAHGYNIQNYIPDEIDGVCTRNVAIINSDNLNEKYIYSLPGEDIENGSLVFWMDNYWLVDERDANMTVYTKAKLIQCNYLLKWVSSDREIIEQWCYVEDGTKYLTGEMEDRNFILSRGDSRIAITLARNIESGKLGRTNRFLVDDELSQLKIAYTLSKPLKFSNVFNGQGVYKWVLQEVQTTDDDNQDLLIADYYKYFPKEESDDSSDAAQEQPTGKKVWL